MRAEFDVALDHPLPDVVDAALADGFHAVPLGVRSETRHADWAAHARLADLLDRATSDDPKAAREGIDALATPEAVPFLLSVARQLPAPKPYTGPRPAALRTPPGRLPRRIRAIVALGLAGDRSAVEDLMPCLDDLQDDGPVRFAAATALGDLGDPRAIPALCRVLFYLGDVHRPRDSWDYPGVDNTDVPADRWDTVEYYAIDVAAADALLRLGVGNAAEWLIRERLHVRIGSLAHPRARRTPWTRCGAPSRTCRRSTSPTRACRRAPPRTTHSSRGGAPARSSPDRLDETDEGVRAATRGIVRTIGEKSVMELQIAKRAATLIGPAMLPAVLEGLATSTRKVQRAELALVLGTLGDRRAVDPLLALSRDPVPAVRGNAILALARFVGTRIRPAPRGGGEGPDRAHRRARDRDARRPRGGAPHRRPRDARPRPTPRRRARRARGPRLGGARRRTRSATTG